MFISPYTYSSVQVSTHVIVNQIDPTQANRVVASYEGHVVNHLNIGELTHLSVKTTEGKTILVESDNHSTELYIG